MLSFLLKRELETCLVASVWIAKGDNDNVSRRQNGGGIKKFVSLPIG